MDSPHLLHMGFLLLALAAPHPSIAMSTAGPAGWTRGSKAMAVYRCEDWESCKRKDEGIDFNDCTKIAEIQHKKSTIPGVTVELMANESHITVCFEQANFCPEEIYGIWDETVPPKHWCGILNCGENGGGNISTENQTVCCEAEANAWRQNPLKCYIQESHPKHSALAVPIPGEGILGNPEFLTSKKSSLGIWLAFLFVGVCTGWGMFYFLRLWRRQVSRQDSEASDRERLTDNHLQGRKLLCQQHPPPLS
ncbi:uncharacterized protein LOC132081980 isoform X1 [Ammospiza nelsoni]|uniref:uncharacterized protein LOC132081980 isoform X1 n=1 Tax=Ammospiza nelsoni TaxID=2857394 RepID=UPI002869C058|nr:uncharacterized protein LOC132081980 isoform X1 [Ammospiza nelsoni]